MTAKAMKTLSPEEKTANVRLVATTARDALIAIRNIANKDEIDMSNTDAADALVAHLLAKHIDLNVTNPIVVKAALDSFLRRMFADHILKIQEAINGVRLQCMITGQPEKQTILAWFDEALAKTEMPVEVIMAKMDEDVPSQSDSFAS